MRTKEEILNDAKKYRQRNLLELEILADIRDAIAKNSEIIHELRKKTKN